MFLMLTMRPDFAPMYPPHPSLLRLFLERLDDSHVKRMMQRIAGTQELLADIVSEVVAKTDGVLLFVGHLTKMVLESGALEPPAGEHISRRAVCG